MFGGGADDDNDDDDFNPYLENQMNQDKHRGKKSKPVELSDLNKNDDKPKINKPMTNNRAE